MVQVKQGDAVKVHYAGRLDDHSEFDSSRENEPLEFVVGAGEVIPGFETAVIGMSPGQNCTVSIPCEEAYGPRQQELVAQVERKGMPADLEIAVGSMLEVSNEDGSSFAVMVVDMDEQTVTIDANHPLAGQTLNFEIELVEIL